MKKLKIYLDNCCFNRPYDDQTQIKVELETKAKLRIQEKIYNEQIELVWSYILKFENSKNLIEPKRKAIAEWKKLSVDYIDRSVELELIAKNIELSGIKPFDALHLACAIKANCDYFITVDDKILRYKDNKIKILNPIKFLTDIGGKKNDE